LEEVRETHAKQLSLVPDLEVLYLCHSLVFSSCLRSDPSLRLRDLCEVCPILSSPCSLLPASPSRFGDPIPSSRVSVVVESAASEWGRTERCWQNIAGSVETSSREEEGGWVDLLEVEVDRSAMHKVDSSSCTRRSEVIGTKRGSFISSSTLSPRQPYRSIQSLIDRA
jgi:hypothetical protein